MSQPVTFEMEGTCQEGQMIVVKGWPDLGCQDVPKPIKKVVRETIIQREPLSPIPKKEDGHPLLWLFALALLVSAAILLAAHWIKKEDN